MPERTSYAQGTPCWVELSTPDPPAARAFYADLFGWDYRDNDVGDSGGTYAMALLDGKMVAAISGQHPDQVAQGVPPNWSTYLAVDDLDAVAAGVEGAGGQLIVPPSDVAPHGRMAIAFDPQGASVVLWQAGEHVGAELINDPGSVVWNELRTSDRAAGAAFLATVFGVRTEDTDAGGRAYTLFFAGDEMAGGIADAGDQPNYWDVSFATADIAATVARAEELGATVVLAPMETPIGHVARCLDPTGASFSLFQPGDPPEG